MERIRLYRYIRPDGGVTVSPNKPEHECTEMFRLIADDGYLLTDGREQTTCVDTATPDKWMEIEGDEIPAEDALDILVGKGE